MNLEIEREVSMMNYPTFVIRLVYAVGEHAFMKPQDTVL